MGAHWRTGFFVAVACCAALTVPLSAHAQSDDAQRYLTAAARLYENLEYERALEQLKRARTLSRGVDDDVAIALYEGIILADMGKKEDSTAAFKEGLFLKPDAQLPVKVSPKVTADFEAVRREVKKELAPILAKQEAERKKKEEEERRQKEEAAKKQADEQKRLNDQLAAQDAEKRRIAEEAKRNAEARAKLEQEKKLAEQRRREEAQRTTPEDTPKDRVLVVQQDHEEKPYLPGTETKVEHHTPVATWVLGGVALAAGGAGGYFGMQSRNQVDGARGAQFQDDTDRQLKQASDNALYANVAFAAAGAAAIGALVTFLVGGSDAVASPPPAHDVGGGSQ